MQGSLVLWELRVLGFILRIKYLLQSVMSARAYVAWVGQVQEFYSNDLLSYDFY